jgi:hypothetical protein
MGDMKAPIACSLTVAEAGDRTSEWRQVMRASVREIEVDGPVARLRLVDDDEALVRVADLAEREQQCCPFFGFSIELGGGQRWLRISVPPEAVEVLGQFSALIQQVED